jgi:hypothetical protein
MPWLQTKFFQLIIIYEFKVFLLFFNSIILKTKILENIFFILYYQFFYIFLDLLSRGDYFITSYFIIDLKLEDFPVLLTIDSILDIPQESYLCGVIP